MHNCHDVLQKTGKPVITTLNRENNYQLVALTILLPTSKRVSSGTDSMHHSTVKVLPCFSLYFLHGLGF